VASSTLYVLTPGARCSGRCSGLAPSAVASRVEAR
jgi:hypothetical protein